MAFLSDATEVEQFFLPFLPPIIHSGQTLVGLFIMSLTVMFDHPSQVHKVLVPC